jgi:hypothetical protein
MQTLLFAMSGEHVGPFVRVPRAHHTVHEKRVTLHVLFRGLTRARNGHRAKRRVVLVKYCLYHQVGVILVQFFRTCDMGGYIVGCFGSCHFERGVFKHG